MSDPDLDAAVTAAKRAFLDLVGLMSAHGLDFRQLPLLLRWPMPVQEAFGAYQGRVDLVIKLLAAREGVDVQRLSERDRQQWITLAYAAVMD